MNISLFFSCIGVMHHGYLIWLLKRHCGMHTLKTGLLLLTCTLEQLFKMANSRHSTRIDFEYSRCLFFLSWEHLWEKVWSSASHRIGKEKLLLGTANEGSLEKGVVEGGGVGGLGVSPPQEEDAPVQGAKERKWRVGGGCGGPHSLKNSAVEISASKFLSTSWLAYLPDVHNCTRSQNNLQRLRATWKCNTDTHTHTYNHKLVYVCVHAVCVEGGGHLRLL